MKSKTLWLSLILLMGAGLSLFLMFNREKKTSIATSSQGANAFMTHPIYKVYNDKGELHSQITAAEMKHFAFHDSAFFIKPNVLIYTQGRVPWHVHSNYGKSQKGINKVFLYGRVILHQPARPSQLETTIKTSELTIYPICSFAKTKNNVKIIRPNSIIYGKGVEANLKTGIIKVLTQSRGIYEPNQNQH